MPRDTQANPTSNINPVQNSKANRWEAAHKLASSYMSEGEVRVLYMEQAQKMEASGSLLEAEKLFLQVGEVKRGRVWVDLAGWPRTVAGKDKTIVPVNT